MRIYSSKTYTILGKEGRARVAGGEELRHDIAVDGLVDEDRVYEAKLFAVAREKRQIELVDALGQVQPVEMETTGNASL